MSGFTYVGKPVPPVDGEERVYNDYDFFVIVPFTSRKRRKQVSERLATVKAK